ncbi:hypothetical protein KBC75_03945 [Candidatus Shapirobacteria bacterium]|nr:hypothetical protein [Candidatus Shapirobacteria bacterium]
MLFKNIADSASQLALRIQSENLAHLDLMYISPDAKEFADLVSQNLHQKDSLLLNIEHLALSTEHLVIVDDGSTPSNEFDEFTVRLRKLYPQVKTVLAIPIIPEAEVKNLEICCDSLIYLSAEPLFFSLKQFYSDTPLI